MNHQQALNLQNLVNLALNSPEIGAVNFNVLKKFLLELLKALKLENFELKFDNDNDESDLMRDIKSLEQSTKETDRLKKLLEATKPLNQRIFDIEDKINRFERQFDALDSLPNNANIIEKTKESLRTDNQQTPLLEVWQYKQLSKRVELIEDGLNKLTSLVHDLIGDISKNNEALNKNSLDLDRVKDFFAKNQEKLNDIGNLPSSVEFSKLADNMNSLKEKIEKSNALENKLSDLNLQLKDIEKKLEDFINNSDLVSTDLLNSIISEQQTKFDNFSSESDSFKNSINKLNSDLSKLETSNFEIDNLKTNLSSLLNDVDELRNNLNKIVKMVDESMSADAFNREIDYLKLALKDCIENNKTNKNDMILLHEANSLLEKAKIDRDWISKELDKKANKDEANNLKTILEKTKHLEDIYKRDHEDILKQLESKLDKLEFKDFKDPLKDYIAKQLNKIKKLQEAQQVGYETNAAGMKRPYIYFKCLSCDKPIHAHPQPAVPSLPYFDTSRPIPSYRPYTVYQRINPYSSIYDTDRPCGGSHTVTTPQRKLKAFLRVHDDSRLPVLPTAYRSSLTGNDGKIYKGEI